MEFASIRIITQDVERLAAFYERVTGLQAVRRSPEFAEIRTGRGTVAIASTRTAPIPAAANRSVIVEFRVDDVDKVRAGLELDDVVQEPTTMPWGNRSLLFRDLDGNLVNFFTPPAAPQP
jgi:catechol 2,3-dioxygenase-like lactoylglutathione lyase family enzyme